MYFKLVTRIAKINVEIFLFMAISDILMCLTGQVTDAMDYLLAEFNRVCIYTVPKHLHALNVSLHGMVGICLFLTHIGCAEKNTAKVISNA